ncbi:non-ribosomal peptide synthetase [Colletotrichum higginsianum]|uniref:Non-ribosomal peptide synthetase n=1 Tax=Colletotrichum higginsianum (strain IMI 349063) TaxID=759273 RepID=H1V701_COLHI|nr:Non-ribosomal peptide synthetase [Colletotrichum higginsianum IMI 349063]OBR02292.1 Non-ribosomal peptide synthetase [Colletotrichum higginsianum IMI 349063]CCF36003.1 non-ribosomal peptide synthetase [Colletotrichum higginsianum]
MLVHTDTPARSDFKAVEVLFFHHHQFQSLKKQARCSASSVIRLACAISLQSFWPTKSASLVFQGNEVTWQHWSKTLVRNEKVVTLLQEAGHDDTTTAQLAKEASFRHALSVIALEDDLQTLLDIPSLASVKSIDTNIEVLFTASWDPFTKGILLKCEYTPSWCSDWQAKRVLATFRQVLQSIVSHPYSQLSDIELLNDLDHQQCLDWNQSVPERSDTCLHQLIERNVHEAPLSPAIEAWDGQMSYAELGEASDKVAHELCQRGVSPESTVALFFDKSIWNTVATVAVLRSSGAFVPLDPSQPDSRISYILGQVKAKVILCSRVHEQRLLGLSDNVVALDEAWIQSALNTPLPHPLSPQPWNLAYIMFTSGSTGEPKGVMIDHSACAAAVISHGKATGFNQKTRALQYARHTFDASIAEILTTLAFGGCVVVPSADERLNNITAVIQEKRVNWAFFTPSLIRLLEPFEVPGLATIVLGGEPIGQDNIEKWAPGRNLVAAYGPTENTVFSTMHPLPPSAKAGVIGRGVGTLCWIADPEDPNRLSPVGAPGELLLESPQLARGYLNFAENEGPNQAFIRNPPWLAKCGRRSRLYRTGDMCRFDQNGVIHFEGRKDTQLKISGQRLEASEVEYHLRAAFGVTDIVVDVLERPGLGSKPQSKALVAFVCMEKMSERELSQSPCIMSRQHTPLLEAIPKVEDEISQRLPSWMHPSTYIPLSYLPLSPNGKADVKRLRREAAALTSDHFYSFAQTEKNTKPVEETDQLRLMRQLWTEVLGVQSAAIPATSSFFRLGGDSLAAIGLVTAARRKGLQLSVAQIFKTPVLQDLCLVPTESKRTTVSTQPLELLGDSASHSEILDEIADECGRGVEDIEDSFPCTPLQEGLMALSTSTTNSYLVQYVMHLPADADVARLKRAWESVAQVHGILRTRLVDTLSSGILQVVVRESLAWSESFNLEEYLEMDLKQPLSFGAQLNRFGIVYAPNGSASRMVWTVHHAVTDGHAVALTLQSVRAAFAGALKPVEASFASFVKYYKSMHQESASRYWSSVFEGVELTAFPPKPLTDTSTPGQNHSAFARRTVPFPVSSTGATATNILRAAWALVISRFSGSDDVVFGVTTSGRNAPFDNIESVLGPIIATVPLRVRCDRKTLVRDLLENIQMSTVNMIPYEQMGMQNIARVNAACRAACDFQSMMIVQPEVDMAVDGEPFIGFDRPQDLDKFRSHAVMVECNLGRRSVFLNVNYDTRYLESSQMGRLLDYFESALDFLVSSENQRIEDFSSRPTFQDLADIRKWNEKTPYTVDSCVHHVFQEHSRSQPDAQAVFAWDGLLSFAELDVMASRLARVLVELQVGPEVNVAYCFEKSMYTVVSMLAILKAGGTMVPLDPAHPPERKSFVIRKISANVVVASAANAAMFLDMDVHVVVVDAGLFARLEELQVAPFSSTDVQPHNAATVLFTSGSTGEPKGVVQEHKTLCSAAHAHAGAMDMSGSSRVLQFSAHVFDVSVIEVVNSFILGACICIPSDEERMNDLAGFITRSRADWAFFTPSFARTLDPRDLPTMKTVCMGGEAMTLDAIQTWSSRVQLINSYGPCEGSVCTTANLSSGHFGTDAIGRGANSLVWIVEPDNHDRLVPIGSTGEILIEGPNVARGYLGDPEKTAKAFITNPAWIAHFEAGSVARRMYKTGDLGMLNSDGTVSYLGRKDTQIKLRGQRIEPGEVEHHLAKLLPLGSIVVVDALILPGVSTKSLVAFIELGSQTSGFVEHKDVVVDGLSDRLRQQLASVLPAYMVPSHIITVKQIPFTSTGKLDRRTLRDSFSSLSVAEVPEPRLDEDDAAAVTDLLRADEHIAVCIGNKLADLLSGGDHQLAESLRGHNFNPYYAGMDSIQVISLSTFVRKTYNVSLPIQKYMNSAATIRDIAQLVIDDRHSAHQDEELDLLRDIEIHDQKLAALPLPRASEARADLVQVILLTGATGFLGNQLLAQILERPETRKVIALVRGQDSEHATERLMKLAGGSSWWLEEYSSRIEVWHGDLAMPRLGLGASQWARLDGTSVDGDLVDAVVHNGAVVNWMADYQALTPANVLSTVNLLTALTHAAASRPVRLTYVSGGHLSTSPDDVLEVAQELKLYPAYSQTKFVAEILVARYAERLTRAGYGSLVSIVKPGLIMGSSSDGISNTDDFLWRVTASALDIGLFDNDERDLWLAAAGVDLVAETILSSCFRHPRDDDAPFVKKILNGLTMGEYWNIVIQETNSVTSAADSKSWLRALHDDVEEKGSTHRLWPVLHFLDDTGGRLGQPLGSMTMEDQLEHQGSVKMALRKSLQYLVAIGYVKSSRTSSVDGDSSTEPTLLSPRPQVFSRTPTTPIWNQAAADSKRLGYGRSETKSGMSVSVAVTPLRTPSPSSDFVAIV